MVDTMLRASGDVMLTVRLPGSFDVTVYKSRSEMVLALLECFDRETLVAIGGRVGKCIASIDAKAEAPYVCPGCHTVGGGPCAPGCIDDEIESEHRHAIETGDYDSMGDEDNE